MVKVYTVDTFCQLTSWHQGENAWCWSLMTLPQGICRTVPTPFLFSLLCRTVPHTKGTYCFGCILPLQLQCPVCSCDQLLKGSWKSEVLDALWHLSNIECFEISNAQNVNSMNPSSTRLCWIITAYCITSLLCNRAPAFANSVFKEMATLNFHTDHVTSSHKCF
jgi:hypothetical protein